MKKEYKKVENDLNIWLPKVKDDEIEGIIAMITEGSYGKQYKIEGTRGVWTTPSHKVLQNRMAKCKVGDEVKIVFIGTEPPKVKGQNPTAMYDVFIAQ